MSTPFSYVDPPDCPEGMTLREWKGRRRAEEERPRRRRLRLRLRRRPRPARDPGRS